MRTVTLRVASTLAPGRAFAALTDWPAHGRHVPFTTVRVESGDGGLGTRFVATTRLGPLRFDDPMEVTAWQPPAGREPGTCTVVKHGRLLHGGATIEVRADGAGSACTWSETIGPGVGPGWLRRVADGVSGVPGRLVFGAVARRLLREAERAGG